ncbi:DUF4180 domain-containing protein [Stenotrophomonas maltophilia]|uniref:DUF4180 domain-containing protein n=1 Tax=Stenotrophomonas maltophilia TaxID=40324 RepID=UPI0022F4003D|nr:DUF4180 domain-containing protein [Stenotrophomonas maltophilia]MDA5341104.1 DUF4180 domain-containing protein [Stenotrophomonas maltophilia]
MPPSLEQIGSTRILRVESQGPALDANGLRDLVGDALGHQAEWIAIPVQRLSADFFELRSGIAGQWLQMLVNYRLRFAVLGDVSGFRAQSESLDAWITECNRQPQRLLRVRLGCPAGPPFGPGRRGLNANPTPTLTKPGSDCTPTPPATASPAGSPGDVR